MLNFRQSSINNYPSTAVFSEDGKYRYCLSRDWGRAEDLLVWIMLNPSIGNEAVLEPTTAGCMKRAQKWGFSGMLVMNLFALIATDPKELKASVGAVGEYNDLFIGALANIPDASTMIIAAWGNHGKHLDRDREVVNILFEKDIYCLGTNKDGSPRHPLHMSHSIRPELWRGAGESSPLS